MARYLPLAAASLLLSLAPAASAQVTNGQNVLVVEYQSPNGQIQGAFYKSINAPWIEKNNNGSNTFTETGRDEWSVYLADPGRSMNIQLDLHTKKVMVGQGAQRSELYNVTNAYAKMTGKYVTDIMAGDPNGTPRTRYVLVGNGQWEERAPRGSTTANFKFRETGRDDWSVYLQDDSRNVSLQLDLHTTKVMYSEAGGSSRQIYTITRAR
jgi:hypothetical protein